MEFCCVAYLKNILKEEEEDKNIPLHTFFFHTFFILNVLKTFSECLFNRLLLINS